MTRRSWRAASEAGFTLTEVLISTAVMLTITAGVFSILNPSQGTYRAQPEVSDMQQRLRVSVDALNKDLIMAGAGTNAGGAAGALTNFFAPIVPYRMGELNPDPPGSFRSDTITLMSVPQTASQTSIDRSMPRTSNVISVYDQPGCPRGQDLCGFSTGMKLLIFDQSGAWNTFTITNVMNAAGSIQRHGPDFNKDYGAGAFVSQVSFKTYYRDATSNQLMQYDGTQTPPVPVVDNLVGLSFEYLGDPLPPTEVRQVPTTGLCSPPCVTYGPQPPSIGADGGTGYPLGENCVFQVVNNQHVPRLADLSGAGSGLVPLTQAMLTDGPWCPDAASTGRFDADLFRIRQVRVTLRVQASSPVLRGTGSLFANAGTGRNALTMVPDQEVRFDVAPRNMNLGR